MSLHAYLVSRDIDAQDYPFYALIMAAMRKADPQNLNALRAMWPDVWEELIDRYYAPGGLLDGEHQ